jgi:hypothetical protein
LEENGLEVLEGKQQIAKNKNSQMNLFVEDFSDEDFKPK